jgi:hypothetical protein
MFAISTEGRENLTERLTHTALELLTPMAHIPCSKSAAVGTPTTLLSTDHNDSYPHADTPFGPETLLPAAS